MKKILLLIWLFFGLGLIQIYANDNQYEIVVFENGQSKILETFTNRYDANSYYTRNLEKYPDISIRQNNKYLKTKYGIVKFNVNKGCTHNIEYTQLSNKETGYLNGCYGIDGAYLDTSSSFKTVTFKVADVVGEVSIDQLEIIPFSILGLRTSSYQVINNQIFHQIKTQLNSDHVTVMINLYQAPSYLKENIEYYSYDGHYFYDDFKKMIDDYRIDSHKLSVNSNQPYFNYFMYLPHRSISNYQYSDIQKYFSDNLMIEAKLNSFQDLNKDYINDVVNRSQLHDSLTSFFHNQYQYGSNALMMLSLAFNESAIGKSSFAYTRNNLFGHAAYDSDAEKFASRYENVERSVYAHARHYISARYSNPENKVYYGSFFGTKQSGMNVFYSSDPYWGEKAASFYASLDQELGHKDFNSQALAIVFKRDQLNIYASKKLDKAIYKLNNIKNYSLIILEDLKDMYKVQLEPSLFKDSHYDFGSSFAYVKKQDIDLVLNPDKIAQKIFYRLTFDSDGGLYGDSQKISLEMVKDSLPIVNKPVKKGYEFIGYEPALAPVTKDTNYKALYRQVKEIHLIKPFKQVVELDDYLDLRQGQLLVKYSDGAQKVLDITTDMISDYDITKPGQSNITITYAGLSIQTTLEVKSSLKDLRDRQNQKLKNYQNLTYEEIIDFKSGLKDIALAFSFKQLRHLDHTILDHSNNLPNYYLDSDNDLSVSGLALAFNHTKIFDNPLFKDTISIRKSKVKNSKLKKLKDFTKAFNYLYDEAFKLESYHNLNLTKPNSPLVISFKPKAIEPDYIYTVFLLNDEGDIIKLKTERTKSRIQFMTAEMGNFIIAKRKTTNNYQDLKDYLENVHSDNMGFDSHLNFILLSLLILILDSSLLIILYSKKKGKLWIDFKKKLRKEDIVPEEKLKT